MISLQMRMTVMRRSNYSEQWIETTEELLKINPDMKIIFASADGAVKDDALASGACDFLSKPFPVSDLLLEIEELIASS